MIRRLLTVISVLIVAATVSQPAISGEAEHRLWQDRPLTIMLPVGQEKILTFPGEVSLEVPEYVQQLSRIQIRSNGSVYWYANEQFPLERVIVKSKFGRVYLLDISASSNGNAQDVIIVDEIINDKYKHAGEKQKTTPELVGGNINSGSMDDGYDYVDMIRYAAQTLYSPQRLVKQLNVARFPVKKRQLPLYRGQEITLIPLASWRSNTLPALYVTAVRAENLTSNLVEIDVRRIRGQWLARAAQHNALGAKGSQTDNTTIYLVSDRSFDEVVQ